MTEVVIGLSCFPACLKHQFGSICIRDRSVHPLKLFATESVGQAVPDMGNQKAISVRHSLTYFNSAQAKEYVRH